MYFEAQVAALCGQHLLNNLVQRPFFQISHLIDIAHELDAAESTLATANEIRKGHHDDVGLSQNISDSGDFSVQVLEIALARRFNIKLVRDPAVVTAALQAYDKNPMTPAVNAFVFNLDQHWFCTRRIGSSFFLFNSLDTRPREIKFLTAYCAQLQAEQYSVFLVEGTLPPLDPAYDNVEPEMTSTVAAVVTKPKPEYFTGQGFSLKKQKPTDDARNTVQDDVELQQAIAASLIEQERKAEIIDQDKNMPAVIVGIQVVLPRTGRRVRRKFPPGALGKDVFDFVREQTPEMTGAVMFTLIDPVTKAILLPGSALARFAPSATFAVEEG